MTEHQQPDPALAIALAWQPRATRPALAALFDLDRRLATLVARAKEPLLAQMRLAWWRDRLNESALDIVAGEPLLAQIALHWGEHAKHLSGLVDGWENLLGEAPLASEAIKAFAAGRGAALAAFAALAGASDDGTGARSAGRTWALADFAWRTTHPGEREIALALGKAERIATIRSRKLRGVAVLGGLSRRALQRGEPLMQGRGAALHAIRLGMFGR